MRAFAQLLLVIVAARAAHGAAASPQATVSLIDPLDDPKCARGECRPRRARALDEDDPKLARGLVVRHKAPAIEASYRFFQIADPYGGSLPFHLVEIDGFPLSRIFRLGISLSGGAAPRYDAWLFLVGMSAGIQYPARVTPFLDLRLAVGVIGAHIIEKTVVSYAYAPMLEAGISVYLASRLHLTVAVGWAHPVYGGVDAKLIQQQIDAGIKPKYDVQAFGFDTVTVRAGLGF